VGCARNPQAVDGVDNNLRQSLPCICYELDCRGLGAITAFVCSNDMLLLNVSGYLKLIGVVNMHNTFTFLERVVDKSYPLVLAVLLSTHTNIKGKGHNTML